MGRLCRFAIAAAVLLAPPGIPAARAAQTKARRTVALRPSPRPAPRVRPKTLGYEPIVLGEDRNRYRGEPISLDLKDADIKDVLRTFAELTGLNIAIDPDVKGSVTVRLHDVPWDQALDLILKINGLGYVLEGNIVRVGSPSGL